MFFFHISTPIFSGISQPCLMTPKGNARFFFMGRPWSSSTLSALACFFSANWPRWTRVDTLWYCTFANTVATNLHVWSRVYMYTYVYTISLYIYTHVYYYMIYMHDTLHFTYNLKMTMTVVPVSLLVFDSEPAVIAALQGKEVRCRRCQTCVPRCAFPSFSDCSRHSGSFRHIFDRDQCSMTVQWNTREPFDVKFIYI